VPVSDEARSELRDAWGDFCRLLQETGDRLIEGQYAARDDAELAQDLRYLTRSAVFALQSRLEFNDPDFPRLYRSPDDRTVWGGPNVYQTYTMVPVRGDATYRMRGEIGDRDALLGRDLFSFSPGFQSDDGTFDVVLSAAPAEEGTNWIALAPELIGDCPCGVDYRRDESFEESLARRSARIGGNDGPELAKLLRRS